MIQTSSCADDTSIFSVVSDISISADQMNNDLEQISMWVITGRRLSILKYRNRLLNYLLKEKQKHITCPYQKHLDVFLDKKINFQHHITKKFQKQVKE